jgi:nitrogenase molybdenum-iron protein alpha chain
MTFPTNERPAGERPAVTQDDGATPLPSPTLDKGRFLHFYREFTQASICQQLYNILTLLTIRGAALVVHGPAGCSAALCGLSAPIRLGRRRRGRGRQPADAKWFSTDLSEQDVVNGGEARLVDTLRYVDRVTGADAIFVFTSCVSGIIGDDVESILRREQPAARARLVPVVCDGFRKPAWGATCNPSYVGMVTHLLEPRTREASLVNVVTSLAISAGDEAETRRLLRTLGLTPNFIPCFSTVEDIRRAAAAAASTSLCHSFGDEFLAGLQTDNGIPYVRGVVPLGIASTDRWLLALADVLGKTERAARLADREHARIRPALDRLRRSLQGARVFVGASLARAATLSELAGDLGFELVGLSSFQNSDRGYMANLQHAEQANIIRRLKPDVHVIRDATMPLSGHFGVPVVSLHDVRRCAVGYEGVLSFGERLATALANPNYYRAMTRESDDPYRASWYEQDPFRYLRMDTETAFGQ